MSLLVVIGGPTAVGKTETSLSVAKYFQTEIISADSRQFYKELRIGTAKPSPSELEKVSHHFIDKLHVWEPYNAGDFERDVLELLPSLFQEHGVIIMTGGSGMYVDAVCKGFDAMPDVDISVRNTLNARYKSEGLSWLQAQVKKFDPLYYEEADIHNPQRLVRALEIISSTGKPYSSFRIKGKVRRPFHILYIGLELPREVLYERINQRVDRMIEEGLIEEVKNLKNYAHHNALQTVGYQEIYQYLKGEITLAAAIELIKRNTRRYAKRQLTWFKRYKEMEWFSPADVTGIIYKISSTLDKSNLT